jgi:hypothetical protein
VTQQVGRAFMTGDQVQAGATGAASSTMLFFLSFFFIFFTFFMNIEIAITYYPGRRWSEIAGYGGKPVTVPCSG